MGGDIILCVRKIIYGSMMVAEFDRKEVLLVSFSLKNTNEVALWERPKCNIFNIMFHIDQTQLSHQIINVYC